MKNNITHAQLEDERWSNPFGLTPAQLVHAAKMKAMNGGRPIGMTAEFWKQMTAAPIMARSPVLTTRLAGDTKIKSYRLAEGTRVAPVWGW